MLEGNMFYSSLYPEQYIWNLALLQKDLLNKGMYDFETT